MYLLFLIVAGLIVLSGPAMVVFSPEDIRTAICWRRAPYERLIGLFVLVVITVSVVVAYNLYKRDPQSNWETPLTLMSVLFQSLFFAKGVYWWWKLRIEPKRRFQPGQTDSGSRVNGPI
jgi:uncharacterized membrane protein